MALEEWPWVLKLAALLLLAMTLLLTFVYVKCGLIVWAQLTKQVPLGKLGAFKQFMTMLLILATWPVLLFLSAWKAKSG